MSVGGAPSDDSADGTVTVIGTAHVSPESLAEVRQTIADQNPDVVAVELCGRRYTGPTPDGVPYAGDDLTPHLRTLLFLPLMQHLQSRAAADRGLDPDTTDMGAAIESAIDADAHLVLLDRDILATFAQYWTDVSLRETLRVIASLGLALVRGDSALLNTGDPENETDAEVVDDYLETTAERFPTFRTMFIDERDERMAERLAYLQQEGYDTVAVVGAAHKPGIEAALGTDSAAVGPQTAPLLDPRPDIHSS